MLCSSCISFEYAMGSSILSLLRPRLPQALLGLLLLLHLGLAAKFHIQRAFIPFDIVVHHSSFRKVVDYRRLLEGYESNEQMDNIGSWPIIIGPPKALPWSDPHFLWQELSQGRLANLWHNPKHLLWTDWPHPLFLAALVHLMSGGSILATALVPQLYLAILLLSVFGIGRMAGDKWTGLVAAIIVSGYPGIIGPGLSHHDSMPLAALGMAVVYLLLKSKGFSRLGPSALAGLVIFLMFRSGEIITSTALGGIICIGPFLWALWSSPIWRRPKVAPRVLAGLLLFLGQITVILFLEWPRIYDYIFTYVPSYIAQVDWQATVGPGMPECMARILPYLAYLVEFSVELVQPLMFLWLLIGAVLLWRAPAGLRLALVLMVMIPLLALSWIPKKSSWYVIPLLPGLALITAHGLAGLRSARAKTLALCLASLSSLFMLVGTSLAPDFTQRTMGLAGLSTMVRNTVQINTFINIQSSNHHLNWKAAMTQFIRYHEEKGPARAASNLAVLLTAGAEPSLYFRYAVELKHPDILTISIHPSDPFSRKIPWHQIRYLILFDEFCQLTPMLKSEDDFYKFYRENLKDFKYFITGMNKLNWTRVDLASGPIYQQVP